MKKIFYFSVLWSVFFAISCSNEQTSPIENISTKFVQPSVQELNTFKIPIEDALKNLETIIAVIDAPPSFQGRAVRKSSREIKNVQEVKRVMSRAVNGMLRRAPGLPEPKL